MNIGDVIAGAFGSPVDRETAFAEGRYRSAQTESAIQQARLRRSEAQAKEREEAGIKALGDELTPIIGAEAAAQVQAGANAGLGNYDQLAGGVGKFQDQSLQRTVAGPADGPDAVARARAALAPGSYHRTRVEGGMLLDDANPTKPTVTPVGQAQIRNYDEKSASASGADGKPLPVGALKMIDEATQALSAADQSETLVNGAVQLLQNGQVDLGLLKNAMSRAKNFVGASTPESQAYASIQQTLEKLRNNYLLLAKGVQTEGDAQRAWASEIGEAAQYDNALALQQLQKAGAMLDMARAAQNRRIDNVYTNYGRGRPDAAPAAPAAPAPAAPAAATPRAFNSVQEAEAANLPPGTRITIGGRAATVQ